MLDRILSNELDEHCEVLSDVVDKDREFLTRAVGTGTVFGARIDP